MYLYLGRERGIHTYVYIYIHIYIYIYIYTAIIIDVSGGATRLRLLV